MIFAATTQFVIRRRFRLPLVKVFKAYDVREYTSARIVVVGYATYTKAKKIVIPICVHPSLYQRFRKGLTSQGVDVINIGLCSTPICYYANGTLAVDGSIMITASHNGKGWNGFKICKAGSDPLSYKNGLKKIEAMMEDNKLPSPTDNQGKSH